MNIKKLLQNKEFKNKYILKLLIEDIFSFTKEDLYKNWDKEINENTFKKIEKKYKDYEEKKTPIEYILGYTYFMGEKIYVDKNTLIPRPETEYLVSYAYNFLKTHKLCHSCFRRNLINVFLQPNKISQCAKSACDANQTITKNKNYTVFDIGTGSGIIGNILNILTGEKVICSDISEKILNIAYKNNKNNIYIKSNLGKHLKNYKGKFLICSNLPYVKKDFQLDDFTKKEPSTALFAGKEGLDLYIKLIEQIFKLENKIECFFELTTKQGEILIREFNLNGKLLDTCHENIKILNFNKKRAI